jgi:transcriptional/translational regulatory protein YebC/TACO1
MEHALELSVEDVIVNEDTSIDVITTPENFIATRQALIQAGFQPAEADVFMRAGVNVAIADKDTAEKVMNLIDMLEDLDDVQTVCSNADIATEVLQEMDE